MTLRTTARRNEASNEGCNSGPTGHDFTDDSNVLGLSLKLGKNFWTLPCQTPSPSPSDPPPTPLGGTFCFDWLGLLSNNLSLPKPITESGNRMCLQSLLLVSFTVVKTARVNFLKDWCNPCQVHYFKNKKRGWWLTGIAHSRTLGPQKGPGFQTQWCAGETSAGPLSMSLTWGCQVANGLWGWLRLAVDIQKGIQSTKRRGNDGNPKSN